MILRGLGVLALGFMIIHTAKAQDYPYSARQGWVERENATTAYLQEQAEQERIRENAHTCHHLLQHYPSIDFDSCMQDPTSARNAAIERENARRQAIYEAQQRVHEHQLWLYRQQQEAYERELELAQRARTPY